MLRIKSKIVLLFPVRRIESVVNLTDNTVNGNFREKASPKTDNHIKGVNDKKRKNYHGKPLRLLQ